MNKNTDTTIEKVLENALLLYERGIETHEIIKRFTEHKEELETFFTLIAKIKEEKDTVLPREESLQAVVSTPYSVTNNEQSRYRYERVGETNKGRTSTLIPLPLLSHIVHMSKKIYIIVGIAALVAILFIGNSYLIKTSSPSGQLSTQQEEQPETTEGKLAYEVNQLASDLNEIDGITTSEEFDTMEEDDLTTIEAPTSVAPTVVETTKTQTQQTSQTQPTPDFSSLNALEQAISSEITLITQDILELDSVNTDSSLDDIDQSLGGII